MELEKSAWRALKEPRRSAGLGDGDESEGRGLIAGGNNRLLGTWRLSESRRAERDSSGVEGEAADIRFGIWFAMYCCFIVGTG